jgi:hypothetical protein
MFPLCAGKQKLKECAESRAEYKCTDCMTYNKYNQNRSINEDHSTLDTKCPSMQAMIARNKQTQITRMTPTNNNRRKINNNQQITIRCIHKPRAFNSGDRQ